MMTCIMAFWESVMVCIMAVWGIVKTVLSDISVISDIIVALIAAFFGGKGLRTWKYQQQYPEKCKAAKEFSSIVGKITPTDVPGMTQTDEHQHIADDFLAHEKNIKVFLLRFSHVLPCRTRNLLREAIDIAETHKFDGEEDSTTKLYRASSNARDAVGKFDEKIKKACNEMFKDVQP